MSRGKFIVIEGSDGSGKGTQYKLVSDELKSRGLEVATYDFPQYDQESSYFVREYLNGNYGDANELGAYGPSLFFALDRFQAAQGIRRDIAAGKIVLCNRFIGSNLAHQGQKIHDVSERREYYTWLLDVEFQKLQIPKPDLNIVLLVEAEIAQKLVDQKAARNYTDKKRDIHEADLDHLRRAVASYEELCELFPETFMAIHGTKDGELVPIPEITKQILSIIDQRTVTI